MPEELKAPTAGQTTAAQSIDFFRLWDAVFRRRWLILTITSLSLFGSMFYTFSQNDYYIAKVKIYVQNIEQSPLNKDEMVMPLLDRTTYYRTQMMLVQSRSNIEQAVKQLSLTNHYTMLIKKPISDSKAIAILQKKVSTKLLPGTQIIELSVKDQGSEMSAKMANTISESFVKQSLQDRLFVSDQILKWFPNEADTLKRTSVVERLKRIDNIDKGDVVASLPSVISDPVIQSIKEERAKVDAEVKELSQSYTDEHPKMKELKAKVAHYDKEIQVQTDKIVAGLKAGLSGALNVTDIKIVEAAIPPAKPAGPKRLLIVGLATAGTLWAVIMLVLFIDYVDRKLKTENDLKQLGFPFLGYLPLIPELSNLKNEAQQNGKVARLLVNKDFHMNEIAEVRTSVLFSMPKDHHKVIAVTSALPSEGKTTIACLLAASFADSGENVLLIDGDMFRPAVHRYFGIPNVTGLSNCLAGITRAKDTIQVSKISQRLSIMTAGPQTPNAAMLLNSETFSDLIDEVAGLYDRIILDIPPLLIVADGLITMRKAHGVLVVFKYNTVHVGAAKKIREKIVSTHCPLLGAVVNQVDYGKTRPYEGYYYYHYKKYYKNYRTGLRQPKRGSGKSE